MFMAMFRFNLPFVHFARRTVAHLRLLLLLYRTTLDVSGSKYVAK
jgi:hypothetical protein